MLRCCAPAALLLPAAVLAIAAGTRADALGTAARRCSSPLLACFAIAEAPQTTRDLSSLLSLLLLPPDRAFLRRTSSMHERGWSIVRSHSLEDACELGASLAGQGQAMGAPARCGRLLTLLPK